MRIARKEFVSLPPREQRQVLSEMARTTKRRGFSLSALFHSLMGLLMSGRVFR
jgi:hypothetical protein